MSGGINYNKLGHDLTEFFISVEAQSVEPVNYFNCTATEILMRRDRAASLYQNNNLFHLRVSRMVTGVIGIVQKSYLEEAAE